MGVSLLWPEGLLALTQKSVRLAQSGFHIRYVSKRSTYCDVRIDFHDAGSFRMMKRRSVELNRTVS